MRTYLFLLIFCLPTSLLGQNTYEKYQKDFFSFAEQKDFLNVAKTSYNWAKAYPDSIYPVLNHFDFFFNHLEEFEIWEEDSLKEEDEEWYDELWDMADVLEETLHGDADVQFLIGKMENEYGEVDIALEWLSKSMEQEMRADKLRYTFIAATESEDTVFKGKLIDLGEKYKDTNSEYFRTLVLGYATIGNYEKAFQLNFELIRKEENVYDYVFRAFLKYASGDYTGACADMRMIRRKGADIDEEEWVYQLNCNNEDRTPSEVKLFLEKHKPCADSLNQPLSVSRIDFIPKNVKNVRLSSAKRELSSQPFTIMNFKYPGKTYGFIYSRPNEGQTYEDVLLRMFGIFSFAPQPYKGETIYHEPLTAPLPNEFKLCEPVKVLSIYGSLMEFKYVGMENYKLASGKEFSCAKILVSTIYSGLITDVAAYWFSKDFGWIASEDVNGQMTVVDF